MKRNLAFGMIVVGALLFVALAVFINVALGYRHSFTSSDVPVLDFLEGLALLSPVWLVGAALIFFGLRWRKA
jgi:hypothetical protein